MHVQRPNEIPFQLGNVRAYVNPPLPRQFANTGTDQWVYRTDGAIRIKREALVAEFDVVVSEVAQLASMDVTYVGGVLAAVRARL